MKKKCLKILVLVLVFIGAFLFFELQTSQVNEDLTSQMADAKLPMISFDIEGNLIEELHGYTGQMDHSALRDGVVCTGDRDSLDILVDSKGTPVTGISYRIRNLDGSRLLAEGKLDSAKGGSGILTASLPLPTILSMDVEYLLNITLQLEEGSADYYCRLFRSTRCHELECLQFAKEFHENTFREEGIDFVRPYMDAGSGSNSSLQFVTLSSSLDQVMWGDFKGSVSGEPIASFQEINGTFSGLTLSYVLTAVNEQEENEYYNVQEYYRLRYTEDRMYVLNFERTMNQIFRQENAFLTSSDNILLGIRDREVECAMSRDKDAVFFVQEGDLWGYDMTENTLTEIFSFRGAEGVDSRSNFGRHNIRILQVSEEKNVDFAVYGYMNKGSHEGEVALIIYRYVPLMHTIEELAYIPYSVSYEIMKEEVERLLYENAEHKVYLFCGEDLLEIDTDQKEVTVAAEKLHTECCCISTDMRYLAWVPYDHFHNSPQITFLDLENGKPSYVEEEGYDYVQPIAFMDGDFIYGAVNEEDIYLDASRNLVCPVSGLMISEIQDDGLHKIKNYFPSNCKIGSIQVDSFTLYLELVRIENGISRNVGSDSIVNREAQERQEVDINMIPGGSRQRVVQLVTEKQPSQAKLRVFSADVVKPEKETRIELPQIDRQKTSYIYAKGYLYSSSDKLEEAILLANEQMGVVADCHGSLLWKRAKKNYVNCFQNLEAAAEDRNKTGLQKSLSTMILYGGVYKVIGNRLEEGDSPADILKEVYPERRVLELSGLPTENLLYYLSCGSPVLAFTDVDNAILLSGYTATDIYYYSPSDESVHSASYQDINRMLEKCGRRYVTYID